MPTNDPTSRGSIIAIGGAEERDPKDFASILNEFVHTSGGKRARIAVIPTASEEAVNSGREYRRLFRKLGARAADVLEVTERADANQGDVTDLLLRSSGIFITGGDQARLVSLLVGTTVMDTIRRANEDGAVVAGTSAGASILSAHMMVPGALSEYVTSNGSPRKAGTDIVSGFGLLQDIIIDQHFSQRGRIGRLLEAFAGNPGLLGLGIDEDTAAIINQSSCLRVMGSGSVTIIDGRNATSDYFDRAPGEIVTVMDSNLFVLGPGWQFDLVQRRPLPYAGA